jgi:hypothetical protein
MYKRSLDYSGKRTWVEVPDSTKVVCSGVEGAGSNIDERSIHILSLIELVCWNRENE